MLAGDTQRVRKYAQAIRLGTRYILQTQFTQENTFYVRYPERAIGGFAQSLTRIYLRNDYTQHGVMALMRAEENGIFP